MPGFSDNVLGFIRIVKCVFFKTLQKLRDGEIKNHALLLVQAWIAMVARIMQKSCTEELISDVDRHVKLFLSVTCKLQAFLEKGKK